MKQVFTYGASEVTVQHYGQGSKLLVAFPGFGRPAADFEVFASSLGRKYHIAAVDLPWQGNTRIGGYRALEPDEVWGWIGCIMQEQNVEKVSLLGYSIGGRIVLSLLENVGKQVEEVWLLAPDGLRSMAWNRLATEPGPARRLFKKTLEKPAWFFKCLDVLTSLRLIRNSVKRFVVMHMDSPEKRDMLDHVWIAFRRFHPDLRKISGMIATHEIPVRLFFGKYDRIIPPRAGKKLSETAGKQVQVYLLEEGHDLVRERVGAVMLEAGK